MRINSTTLKDLDGADSWKGKNMDIAESLKEFKGIPYQTSSFLKLLSLPTLSFLLILMTFPAHWLYSFDRQLDVHPDGLHSIKYLPDDNLTGDSPDDKSDVYSTDEHSFIEKRVRKELDPGGWNSFGASNTDLKLYGMAVFGFILVFSLIVFFITFATYLYCKDQVRSQKAGGFAKTSFLFITASGTAILAGLGFSR
jgi:hypothetical protein